MKLVANFVALVSAEVVSKLLTFAAFAYLWRTAGPVGAGYVEFAVSFFLLLGLLVDQGFDSYGAREMARAPARAGELIAEIVFARLILATLAFAGAWTALYFLKLPDEQERVVWVYCLTLFALPFLLRWVFLGLDRMGRVAAGQVVRQGVFAGALLSLLSAGAGLWAAGAAELAGTIAAAGYLGWGLRRESLPRPARRFALSRDLLRAGLTIGLSQMLWSARMFGATLLVGLLVPAEELGYFGVAMKILVALHGFIWLYYLNLLPSMSRLWHSDVAAFHDLLRRSMNAVAWMCAAGGCLWYLLAPTVVALASGPRFAPAGPVLQWLGLVGVIAAVSGNFRFALIATGRQTSEMAATAAGTVAALVAMPVAHERAGLTGAALSLVLGEIVVWLAAWILAGRRLGVRDHARSLLGPGIAGAAAMYVLLALPAPAPIRLAVAGAILLLVAVADEILRRSGRTR